MGEVSDTYPYYFKYWHIIKLKDIQTYMRLSFIISNNITYDKLFIDRYLNKKLTLNTRWSFSVLILYITVKLINILKTWLLHNIAFFICNISGYYWLLLKIIWVAKRHLFVFCIFLTINSPLKYHYQQYSVIFEPNVTTKKTHCSKTN